MAKTLAAFTMVLILAGVLATQTKAGDKTNYKPMLPLLDAAPPAKKPFLKAGVKQSVVLNSKNISNPWGYVPFGGALPQQVSQVLPQSPAFKSGLQEGDRILSAQVSGNRLDLIVERDKKNYACKMELPIIDKNTSLKAGLTKQEKSVLENAQLVLLVDSSASMNTRDCPEGISRWQWCKKQASDLYKKGKTPRLSKVSITTFNSQMRSTDNCSLSDLETVFQEKLPEGETLMAAAIEDAVNSVNSQLYSGKPAVIAVITDGRPTDAEAVKKRLIQTANALRDSSLLTIAFIEIGTPEHYLSEFDNELVKQGARDDIVTVFPFAQVNAQGLSKSLEIAIETRQAQRQALSSAKAPVKVPPREPAWADSEPDPEESPKPQAPPKAKPAIQETEQQRLAREKREQEDRKVRRSAANRSYDFSRAQSRTPKAPQTTKMSEPAKVIEVDEKESVRKQQSNRNY